eukprot:CAMPEP_0119375422 /NCGR_PEP_ID=MMETSP1334-20130426/35788_1 /TAXON_ID=127549 /ORGANISM="Calcidiscus leptoporus, Strain RCC1130" /LENGTH=106 /DNA_ID=CAMNT_0007393731 /DNA_START=130 /DNA_END=447 /DNA_ORIENTATION=+
MPLWARYLRTVRVEFSPFSATPSSMSFLGYVSTKKIREEVPKLQVNTHLLEEQSEESAPQMLALTYIDGKEVKFDISAMQLRDILAEIEVQNGRLEMEAIKRGKPW